MKKPVKVTVKSKAKSQKSQNQPKKEKSTSWTRTILEFALFLCWLVITGVAGYFVGHIPVPQNCPQTEIAQPEGIVQPQVENVVKCPEIDSVPVSPGSTHGSSIQDLKRMWKCSQATGNASQINKKIYPKENNYDKTKWKSIITVEPKAFFEKYLSQYPGDTRAVQPVVVFSHKPLDNFNEISEVCKVLDVAIVPDSPGVCVAVTETYHDVASYHMLHADRQSDGTFALTANSFEGKTLPDEIHYAQARALLLEYFNHMEYVNKLVKNAPRYGQNKVSAGCIVESLEDLRLYKNSLASAMKVGISKNKLCAFTTNAQVNTALSSEGVKVIFLPDLAHIGTSEGSVDVGPAMRRHFLQAWLAFAVANSQIKMLWQSPGTVWLDRPDNVINVAPIVEGLWSFKGRKDKRGAPFFVSYDFFVPSAAERPVHLMHEIMLHFDLVLAWKSLDAVGSYRLSENNARYGTTTHILPPFKVLHTEVLDHNPSKINQAVTSSDPPLAVVIPSEQMPPKDAETILTESGLWFLK